MTLNELISSLEAVDDMPLYMVLPSGDVIPEHFHITEVGRVHKKFIDCGGTQRETTTCTLQVWTADDKDHRLTSGKLLKILKMAVSTIDLNDLNVEIEYGPDVVSQYILTRIIQVAEGLLFVLDGKQTDCLAPDKCGVTKCSGTGCC